MNRKRWLSLLLAVLVFIGAAFPGGTVKAADTSDFDVLYEKMMEAYLAGNQMDDWVVEARKEIAEELGLSQYLDERSFLSIEYRNENDIGRDGDIEDKRLSLLVEIATSDEMEMIEAKSLIQTLASSSFYEGEYVGVTQQARVSGAGNGYFTIPNAESYGYCAQNKHDFWSNGGVQYGWAYEWDDAIVRKALYYGPGGPGYYGPYYGSMGADMDYVTFTVGYQNGETANNTKARSYISFLSSLSDPLSSGYKAYKVDVSPDNYQDIAILGYVETTVVPTTAAPLTIYKESNTPHDYSTISSTRKWLTGAVFDIYACDGTGYNTYYTRKVGTAVDEGNGFYTFYDVTLDSNYGYYCVRERTAPTGYQNKYRMWSSQDASYYNNSTFSGRVFSYNSSTQSWSCLNTADASSQTDGFYFADYANEVTVTVTKKDSGTGAKLKGAEFVLYAVKLTSNSGNYDLLKIDDLTDNQDGTYSVTFPFDVSEFKGNDYTYVIQEIKAPDGYKLGSVASTRIWFNLNKDGSGTTEFTMENDPASSLKIQKSSANPELTDNNDCYSLEGAEYTVYSDEACTVSVGTLVTDSNGESNTLVLQEAGTYWVKETVAPYGYALDEEVHEVTILENQLNEFSFEDEPLVKAFDPYTILLGKIDAETNMNKPQGSASLQNAEYTIKFFEGDYAENVNPEDLGVSPDKTWVLKTDEYGFTRLDPEYLVSGDEFYYLDDDANPDLPLGTLVIQESKPPVGYQISDEIYIRRVIDGGGGIAQFNEPEVYEVPLKITITKKAFNTSNLISGTEFTHVKPDGTTEVLKTDENGVVAFYGLEQGNHLVYETKASEWYLLNTNNKIEFNISERNVFSFINTDSLDSSIEYKIGADRNGEVVFYNNLIPQLPFSVFIHKVNQDGKLLDGAEFTLYSDEDLTDVVDVGTTKNGTLSFSGLELDRKYYLKETKAPEGYRLPVNNKAYEIYAEPIRYEGEFNFLVNGTAYSTEHTNINGDIYLSGEKDNRVINVKVVNQVGVQLPDTGSNVMIPLVVTGVLLMVVSILLNKKFQIFKR